MSEQQTWFERQGYEGPLDWMVPVGDEWGFGKMLVRLGFVGTVVMFLFFVGSSLISWQPWVFAPLGLFVLFKVLRWGLFSPADPDRSHW